jgi:hypothetical protein
MINWDTLYGDHGFKSEIQMWQTLLVSLRNSEAIGKYLGVSRGAVQRRRQLLQLHKTTRRGATYRTATKREILDSLPSRVWQMPIEDVALYVQEEHDILISKSYIVKYRRKQGR